MMMSLNRGNICKRVAIHFTLEQTNAMLLRKQPPLVDQLTGSFVICTIYSIIHSKIIGAKNGCQKCDASPTDC